MKRSWKTHCTRRWHVLRSFIECLWIKRKTCVEESLSRFVLRKFSLHRVREGLCVDSTYSVLLKVWRNNRSDNIQVNKKKTLSLSLSLFVFLSLSLLVMHLSSGISPSVIPVTLTQSELCLPAAQTQDTRLRCVTRHAAVDSCDLRLIMQVTRRLKHRVRRRYS